MRFTLLISILSCLVLTPTGASFAQQTVGAIENTASAWDGYTLFTPNTSRETYLINNCGQVVNQWMSSFNPGLSAVLTEDGDLLRAARIASDFNGGGSGGRLERWSWDGVLEWSYDYSTDNYHQHHDFELMPNGNILILAWELRTEADAIASGRDPSTFDDELWPEQIVEVEPIGSDQINIVWEWHLWDHLIQDFDPTKANFGVVEDHPERMDINFYNPLAGGAGGEADWVHLNSVDYNPDLDQIALCSRHLNEIWIIDHSTTSAEAAGSTGGNSGMGGDILYRWGNPAAYGRGTPADQRLFGPHDIQWVEAGRPGEGNLIIYNNGQNRPAGNYSSVDEWIAPYNPATGTYDINPGEAFGPADLSWTYDGDELLYSSNISGCERLPNGNTLMIVGRDGAIHEVDPAGVRQGYYVNPVGIGGPTAQGLIPVANDLFRARRYSADFPGLVGKDLSPGDVIEIGDLPWPCMTFANPVGLGEVEEEPAQFGFQIQGGNLILQSLQAEQFDWVIYDMLGRPVESGLSSVSAQISTQHWTSANYLVRMKNLRTEEISSFLIPVP